MAPSPVTASMRRTPAPIDSSFVMRNNPISPVQWQWVPPQSSRDVGPASTTRTSSPYFSSKRWVAPDASASWSGIDCACTLAFARIASFTSSSTRRSSSGVSARPNVKSNRRFGAWTSEPA